MFTKKFVKDRAKALKIADNLSLTTVVLVGLLCFTTYHAMTNKVILEIIPPHLDEKVSMAYNSVSESYHIKYGLFTAISMGNVTPTSVMTTIEALEYSFTPGLYHRVKATLQEQGAVLKKSGSTLEFKPKTWEYEPETNKTFITGGQTLRPLNGQPTAKTVTYEFIIEVNNYVPFIKSFDLYDGVAHNQRWISENS
ncbi:TraE/TraK family type IV conjugative transfer system protein [Thalassotalea piscium]|uniref:Conjugal transfer protein TraE n=1 Tax=Thalassotalea piscium TaxID=1230533 RepID=A0A7X0NGI1_9GAMM|nr:TraE/TraK family type IV conjugative transfer system protein [Thalassotalea piscium]MBB6543041.1 hypothetical protein [Thalassotalea piscium]